MGVITGLVTFIAAYHYLRIFNSWTEGVSSAAMIVLGYPGELILDESKLSGRWLWWMAAMVPFAYIVHTLLLGLSAATESEADPKVRDLVKMAQVATVISWCTYPVVYLFPMLGISGSNVVVLIQLGYSVSDIVSKCGVGLLVYSITMAKSTAKNSEETPLVNKGYDTVM